MFRKKNIKNIMGRRDYDHTLLTPHTHCISFLLSFLFCFTCYYCTTPSFDIEIYAVLLNNLFELISLSWNGQKQDWIWATCSQLYKLSKNQGAEFGPLLQRIILFICLIKKAKKKSPFHLICLLCNLWWHFPLPSCCFIDPSLTQSFCLSFE